MGRRQQGINRPPYWNELSSEDQQRFSDDNKIAVKDWYLDGTPGLGASTEEIFYSKTMVDTMIEKILRKETKHHGSYELTTTMLYECLERYPIKNKNVAIIGSVTPWHESLCLAYGGIPTTIEYNKLTTDDSRLNLITVDDYNKNPIEFDAAFSISSFEHDGLGRYGDPLDPDGDLKAMAKVREQMLKKDGLLYLAVPTGRDTLWWNAHRIYGMRRWYKLIDGFEMLYTPDSMFRMSLSMEHSGREYYQPAVVLRNKN